jgi:hypothetical protein
MKSFFWYTEDGRRNLTWEPTFYIEKQPTKRWDAFGEYAGNFAQWGASKQIAYFGTAYGSQHPTRSISISESASLTPVPAISLRWDIHSALID